MPRFRSSGRRRGRASRYSLEGRSDPMIPSIQASGFEEEGIFGVYLYFELDERPEPLELWSADFQDFESFVQAVERDGAAQLCVRSDSVLGYFHGQYPE